MVIDESCNGRDLKDKRVARVLSGRQAVAMVWPPLRRDRFSKNRIHLGGTGFRSMLAWDSCPRDCVLVGTPHLVVGVVSFFFLATAVVSP